MWFTRQPKSATMASSFGILKNMSIIKNYKYEGWNFNSGNYLFTIDTK